MLGVRADITPQVARIDAHLLNREARHAPVLRRQRAAHPPAGMDVRASRCRSAPRSTATPASKPTSRSSTDARVAALAASTDVHLDLAHVGIFRALLTDEPAAPRAEAELFDALRAKDVPAWRR